VLGRRLLHDDDGRAWRGWFAAAGLGGFEHAPHTPFIVAELRSGRLPQLGRTRVAFGSYWLLESRERSTAALRAAFCGWLEAEIRAGV